MRTRRAVIAALVAMALPVLACSSSPGPEPGADAASVVDADLRVPSIAVRQGAVQLASGGAFDFAPVGVGATGAEVEFTIENRGDADLVLAGTPLVAVGGERATVFAVTQPAAATVPAGTSTSFAVAVSPTAIGALTAELSIASNDAEISPFVLTLRGTGIEPGLVVRQGASDVASGDSFDLGTVMVGAAGTSAVFVLENQGTADLHLTGYPAVAVSGADASVFTVTQPVVTTLTPGATAIFAVAFQPGSPGAKEASLTIGHDAAGGPFTITLTGTGIARDIAVRLDATDIVSGGSYDFGAIPLGFASPAAVFTIENRGTADLSLTGAPVIAIRGANADEFSVTQPSATLLAPGESTDFSVVFTATHLDTRTAEIAILSDDAVASPYTFTLTGSGLEAVMVVRQGMTALPNGGSLDLGQVPVGEASTPVAIVIENAGTEQLNLGGTPAIAIAGPDQAAFSATQPAATSLAPGSSTAFTITYQPTALGAQTATLEIASDDPDANPYTLTLVGTGGAAALVVRHDANVIANGGSLDLGVVEIGSAGTPVVLLIDNAGNQPLGLTGTPTIALSGDGAADFSVTQPTVTSLAPGASTGFALTFRPTVIGPRAATLTIASDDPGASPYALTLAGTGGAAVLVITQDTTELANGDTFNFGDLAVGQSSPVTFTITNAGNLDLDLTGTPPVAVSGDASDFSVTQPDPVVLAPEASTTFVVTFTPSVPSARNATLSIACSDPARDPNLLNLAGHGEGTQYNLFVNTHFETTAAGGYALVYVMDHATGSTVASSDASLDGNGHYPFAFSGLVDTATTEQDLYLYVYDASLNYLGSWTYALDGELSGDITYWIHDNGTVGSEPTPVTYYNLYVYPMLQAMAPNGYAYVYVLDHATGSTIAYNSAYLDSSGYYPFAFYSLADADGANQDVLIYVYDQSWNYKGNWTYALDGVLSGDVTYYFLDDGTFSPTPASSFDLTVNVGSSAAASGYAYVYLFDYSTGSTISYFANYLDASGYLSSTFYDINDSGRDETVGIYLYDYNWNYLGYYSYNLMGSFSGSVSLTFDNGSWY